MRRKAIRIPCYARTYDAFLLPQVNLVHSDGYFLTVLQLEMADVGLDSVMGKSDDVTDDLFFLIIFFFSNIYM